MKKVISLMLCMIFVLVALTGCTLEEETNTTNTTAKNSSNTSISSTQKEKSGQEIGQEYANAIMTLSVDELEKNAQKQLAEPENGETIAIMHIKDYGDITFKFFEKAAPKAVENFLTHAKDGYYNGLTFHRVIKDFMIQGGDPQGTGMGGESIWGKGFDIEMDKTLLPYRGALCMAKAMTPNSIGSQFYINQTKAGNESSVQYLQAYKMDNLAEMQKKYGGEIFMLGVYGQYTIFGQAISGVELLDKIVDVETDSNDKPKTDVIIESIEVTTFNK